MSDLRWSPEKAYAWYDEQPWLVGCNYIPSSAVNQLEMWASGTFDPETIHRELGWAAGLGFNTVRVYLHDLMWDSDAEGFTRRVEDFLEIAISFEIRPLFVLFDDCWNTDPRPGRQPDPIPGVHNSGWLQSPGSLRVVDPSTWSRLERYVLGVIRAFADDERVLMWDLYNEPGNNGLMEKSSPLLRETFDWARAAEPSQPLTVGLWFDHPELNAFILNTSDVLTFHNYNNANSLLGQIATLRACGRPLICTEYMARTRESRFETHLPIFKQERVGCYNWGLVSGKTQTIYPWGSKPGSHEPEEWFHDIFHPDGTPFKNHEVAFIRQITGVS